ncbi:type 4b pilus protein PilO2 [Klebsiella aerogenes]|uniref:type 4b pilus protein PilO2 n=1 Tax=Klebsiella aerogenes TaxID=548 RepID=UPI002FF12697
MEKSTDLHLLNDDSVTGHSSIGKESPQVRIVTINKKKFVIGLKWQGLDSPRHYMKQARAIGKEKGLDVVAIRHGIGIQAGFAPRRSSGLKGLYSIAVSLVSLINGDWIGAFALPSDLNSDEKEYVVVAKMDGGKIIPWTDKVLTKKEVEELIPDLKSMMLTNDSSVQVYGDPDISFVTDELTLEAVLKPSLLKKQFKIRPLTLGLTKKELFQFAFIITAVISGVVGLKLYMDHRQEVFDEEERQKAIRKIQLDKQAKYETALKNLIHPWVNQPGAKELITYCDAQLKLGDLSLSGWMVSSFECTKDATSMTYNRLDDTGATVENFKKSVLDKFGKDVVISFDMKNFNTAVFSLKNTIASQGDDPMFPIGLQLGKLISMLQALNINFDIKTEEVKPQTDEEKELNLPKQDWVETKFSYTSDVKPKMVFTESEYTGYRISKITYVPSFETGAMKYSVEGSVYGKN